MRNARRTAHLHAPQHLVDLLLGDNSVAVLVEAQQLVRVDLAVAVRVVRGEGGQSAAGRRGGAVGRAARRSAGAGATGGRHDQK